MVSLALTLGDPGGIGPEVVSEAVRRFRTDAGSIPITVWGAPDARLRLPEGVDFRPVSRWDGSRRSAGRISLEAIEAAVRHCLEHPASALLTGPVHKPSLQSAGRPVPGQTELLGELTGAAQVGMLMAAESTRVGGPLRVLLATTHRALREVPDAVTADLLDHQTRLLDRELRSRWEIGQPRIALCALNPHASDGGLFGDEEERIFRPVVESLRSGGVEVEGPVSADTVFSRALAGEFDAVVAPYHDVGMAAFKTVSFGSGVNTTLGLPFPRTSPDHGTAFDIAGTGRADPSSTLEALRLAHRLAGGAVAPDSTRSFDGNARPA